LTTSSRKQFELQGRSETSKAGGGATKNFAVE